MKNKTWFWVLITTLVAVILAGTAAYFSVFGLSKLFAGAGLSALILFGSLEIGKLVSVSVLYRFWKKFQWGIRILFTSMIIGIMLITSMGIYGFLRNAYDQTSNQYNTIQKETKIKENRKSTIQLEVDRYQSEIDSKNNQIDTYMNNRVIQENLVADLYGRSSDTSLSSNESWVYRTRAKETQTNISESDKQINELRDQNNILYQKINSLNDSISSIDREILELESSDISVEIGPLKYLSDLTGKSMDNVVGILIFLIMFVFDPFAILLIIVANRLSLINRKNNDNDNNDDETVKSDENSDGEKYPIKKELKDSIDNISDMFEIQNNNKDKEILDIKKNINEFVENVKKNNESTDTELESICDSIEMINQRIDDLNTNENNNDDIKEVLTDFKDSIKEELNNKISSLNNKIEKNNNNDDIKDLIKKLKNDFDNRLEKVENIIKDDTVSNVTVPGRRRR